MNDQFKSESSFPLPFPFHNQMWKIRQKGGERNQPWVNWWRKLEEIAHEEHLNPMSQGRRSNLFGKFSDKFISTIKKNRQSYVAVGERQDRNHIFLSQRNSTSVQICFLAFMKNFQFILVNAIFLLYLLIRFYFILSYHKLFGIDVFDGTKPRVVHTYSNCIHSDVIGEDSIGRKSFLFLISECMFAFKSNRMWEPRQNVPNTKQRKHKRAGTMSFIVVHQFFTHIWFSFNATFYGWSYCEGEKNISFIYCEILGRPPLFLYWAKSFARSYSNESLLKKKLLCERKIFTKHWCLVNQLAWQTIKKMRTDTFFLLQRSSFHASIFCRTTILFESISMMNIVWIATIKQRLV